MQLSSVNLAEAVKAFVPPLDMTGVPGLTDIQVPDISVLVVNKPFESKLSLPNLPTLSKMDITKKGVGFLSKFKTPAFPAGFSIGGTMKLDDFCFGQTSDSEGSLTLRALLSSVLPKLDLGQLALPDGFPNPLDIQLNQFCYNRESRQLSLSVRVPGTIELIPSQTGLLSLTDTEASVSVDSSASKPKIAFSASSTSSLGGVQLNVNTKRTANGEFFFETATATPSVSLTNLASSLGSAGEQIGTFMTSAGLSDFTLSNVLLQVRTSPRVLTFKATASYKALANVKVEIILYKPFTNDSTIAIGMETSQVSLSEVVGVFAGGIDISNIPFVGSASLPSASVILVNSQVPLGVTLPFDQPSLAELASSLKPGSRLSALFPLQFPRVGRKNLRASITLKRIDFNVSVKK